MFDPPDTLPIGSLLVGKVMEDLAWDSAKGSVEIFYDRVREPRVAAGGHCRYTACDLTLGYQSQCGENSDAPRRRPCPQAHRRIIGRRRAAH